MSTLKYYACTEQVPRAHAGDRSNTTQRQPILEDNNVNSRKYLAYMARVRTSDNIPR